MGIEIAPEFKQEKSASPEEPVGELQLAARFEEMRHELPHVPRLEIIAQLVINALHLNNRIKPFEVIAAWKKNARVIRDAKTQEERYRPSDN